MSHVKPIVLVILTTSKQIFALSLKYRGISVEYFQSLVSHSRASTLRLLTVEGSVLPRDHCDVYSYLINYIHVSYVTFCKFPPQVCSSVVVSCLLYLYFIFSCNKVGCKFSQLYCLISYIRVFYSANVRIWLSQG